MNPARPHPKTLALLSCGGFAALPEAILASIRERHPEVVIVTHDTKYDASLLEAITAQKIKRPDVIVLVNEPAPRPEFVLTLKHFDPADLIAPVAYKPDREWWRGGNPKHKHKK